MVDYKETVFLPQTPFPMKGNLAQLELKLLEKWRGQKLYTKMQQNAEGRAKYILHDGPPYANGNIHLGHALNKILKDTILKSYRMRGYNVPYVPGWDCHGLPIEWKIEEQYRKKGQNKDEVPVLEFREECRTYAQKWMAIQSDEFQRLGIFGDWENPYSTMTNRSEALIVREILTFLEKGLLYRGVRPVMWSVIEKTALAEAEIEYHDHTSPSVYVAFSITSSDNKDLIGAEAVIWTTTPWTLPGNRGIAYGEEITYCLIQDQVSTRKFVVAKDLLESFATKNNITFTMLKSFAGSALKGVIAKHPLYGEGYDFDVPFLPGEHVTTDQGTGLVHTAPGHGEEDFLVGKAFCLEIPETVGGDGVFYAHVPLFAGEHVFKVNPKIIAKLEECGKLLSQEQIQHSYPHSWRSKAPLIFRTTPQWFISLDKDDLRTRALDTIAKDVRWIPAQGQKRIESMVANRPDWCLSRQRTWGVPLTLFMNIKTRDVLRDPKVNQRILEAIEAEGGDAWYREDPRRFLEGFYDPSEYEAVMDCADVWFDSGATSAYVLEDRSDLGAPADLYIEGSDQHRGWFQASLLETMGARGYAPFKTVVTHGFVLDEKGYKMSKSGGNVLAPQKIMEDMGADILRLWVINSDYSEDLRIGTEMLKHQQEIYRRYRNTLRYLLGALKDYASQETISYKDLPNLEKYILHRVYQLEESAKKALENFDFHRFFSELHNFVSVDLSAFYFDVRKDTLYCDTPCSLSRRSVRTVMFHLFEGLIHWLAPVLSFTAEEAYLAFYGEDVGSIHLKECPKIPSSWSAPDLAAQWSKIRDVRRVITGALEQERARGTFGSSLQAEISVYMSPELTTQFQDVDIAEMSIVSQSTLLKGDIPEDAFKLLEVPGVGVHVSLADGQKCERCWKILPEVGNDKAHETLCQRCVSAVSTFESKVRTA